jgi:hypothetical protein
MLDDEKRVMCESSTCDFASDKKDGFPENAGSQSRSKPEASSQCAWMLCTCNE